MNRTHLGVGFALALFVWLAIGTDILEPAPVSLGQKSSVAPEPSVISHPIVAEPAATVVVSGAAVGTTPQAFHVDEATVEGLLTEIAIAEREIRDQNVIDRINSPNIHEAEREILMEKIHRLSGLREKLIWLRLSSIEDQIKGVKR